MLHALALACLAVAQEGQRRPPNVVVLVADDLGWRDLGCTGSSFYHTPNLDRLAREGTRFETAYAAAPVCSPSRAALMTGKAPARLDTTDWFGASRKGALLPAPYVNHLPLEEVTLAEALREAGYETAFLGKWHLGGDGFLPQDQGFQQNIGGCEWGAPHKGYFAPWSLPGYDDSEVPKGTHLTQHLTDRAVGFIEAQASAGDAPFLCWLSYYVVHTPLQAPEELRAPYEAARAALAYTDAERWGTEGARKARLVQDHATYAGMVAALDQSVGRVLDALDRLGLAEDTIVVFTSDNGGLSTSEGHPTSNLPARAGKGWLYEGGLRVPMIWRGPGVPAGARALDPAIGMDVYPTLLELCGLAARPSQHVDGASLAPVFAGAPLAPRALHFHYPHYGNQGGAPSTAVRVGDQKLVHWYEDGRTELFDLARDFGEAIDLAALLPERAVALARVHDTWLHEVAAKLPVPNPEFKP
ncbi:MAG: sulfatase [Planctomycetota bacterium]